LIVNAIVKWFFMKIAIVKLSALGDIVHAMIALQFIKKHYQEALIDWVVEEGFDGILENNPHINQIHRVNLQAVKQSKSLYALWKEFKKIRKFGKYDLVIDMQGLIKSALVARTISSNITLGFDKFSLRESLAAKFYNQTYKIDYAENKIDGDEVISVDNIKIFIDASATMNILGSKIDYIDNGIESGFIFKNPNEKGRCGCGESFSV